MLRKAGNGEIPPKASTALSLPTWKVGVPLCPPPTPDKRQPFKKKFLKVGELGAGMSALGRHQTKRFGRRPCWRSPGISPFSFPLLPLLIIASLSQFGDQMGAEIPAYMKENLICVYILIHT